MTFLYPKEAWAGGSGKAILCGEGLRGRIRQATNVDVETSTHQSAGLYLYGCIPLLAVPDDLERGFKSVITTCPKVNSVRNPSKGRKRTSLQGISLCHSVSLKWFPELKIL